MCGGTCGRKFRIYGQEIVHMGAIDDRTSKPGRFNGILTAMRNQGSADERNIGHTKEQSKLTDGVRQ